jgi:hypothetical protein
MNQKLIIQNQLRKSLILENDNNIPNNFKNIQNTIKTYINYTLKSKQIIDQYVPNTHIADIFKNVLIYSELESNNPYVFNNVKHDPYDSIGNNNPDDYDISPDGKYIKKETYSVGINNILIPQYFDLNRLKNNPTQEIFNTYQKLREKKDIVRNNIILGKIVIRDYTHPHLANSYNIKIK